MNSGVRAPHACKSFREYAISRELRTYTGFDVQTAVHHIDANALSSTVVVIVRFVLFEIVLVPRISGDESELSWSDVLPDSSSLFVTHRLSR